MAEDNKVNALVILKKLEKLGHRAVLAEDGEQALDQLASGRFDLVLMDLQMPRLGGLSATKRYRAAQGTVPIVALTANADAQEKEVCLAAGMQDYLTKPVSHDRLVEALSSVGVGRKTVD